MDIDLSTSCRGIQQPAVERPRLPHLWRSMQSPDCLRLGAGWQHDLRRDPAGRRGLLPGVCLRSCSGGVCSRTTARRTESPCVCSGMLYFLFSATSRATLADRWCARTTEPSTSPAWWAGATAAGRRTSLACTPTSTPSPAGSGAASTKGHWTKAAAAAEGKATNLEVVLFWGKWKKEEGETLKSLFCSAVTNQAFSSPVLLWGKVGTSEKLTKLNLSDKI